MVKEFLQSRFRLHSLFATADFEETQIPKTLIDHLHRITQKELERISLLKSPNQVLGLFQMREDESGPSKQPDDLILILDDIKDPGNLGTIIRTADWFGIKSIVCSPDTVDVYNPKVIQSTMGSLARVRVYYADLENYLEQLSETTTVYGAMLNSQSVYEMQLPESSVLIIGSESHGIANNILPYVNHKISIPTFSSSGNTRAESLNASIATAILCSEFRRQHK